MQQATKKLYHPDYKRILDKIKISLDLVPNSEAKEAKNQKLSRPSLSQHQKQKAAENHQKDPARKMTSNLAQVLKTKKMARRIGKLSTTELAKLEKLYTSGPAAYGSARNLQETSKMPEAKIDTFLQQKDSHTKYRQVQRKFPRLKVFAYEINKIWSIDVAYVDKLAKYNNGVKYLLVAAYVLSRFLRIVPMRSKSAPDAAKEFEKMIEKVQPQKLWSDKGTEFKGAFKNLCDKRGIATYTTASETKSAFAERNIRSPKNIMYKHMKTNGHIITSAS